MLPDRTGRHAEAAITVEPGFDGEGLVAEITSLIVEQARSCHFSEVRVLDQSSTTDIRIAPAMRYAANG
jgi:hypothetical protein